MCNMHSITRSHEAVRQYFKLSANRTAAFNPMAGIYPSNMVPIIRKASEDDERELVLSSWGFVLLLKGQAPKRVTNFRDDKLKSPFWSASFKERRCLVPATAFAEPKGKMPATWHWFALNKDRPLFALAGIWRTYKGPLKKDGEKVELDVHSFMTTKPNSLVATIHPKRMPVMLTTDSDYDCWLNGTTDQALELVKSYPADKMEIVQSATDKTDLLTE